MHHLKLLIENVPLSLSVRKAFACDGIIASTLNKYDTLTYVEYNLTATCQAVMNGVVETHPVLAKVQDSTNYC